MDVKIFKERKILKRNLVNRPCPDKEPDNFGLANLSDSSIFAVSQIGHSSYKILWTVVLVGCLVGSVCRIHTVCHCFWQYPAVVNFQINLRQELDFPAVTVCNLNRMKITNPLLVDIGSSLVISERRSLQQCRKDANDESDEFALKFLMDYYKMEENERFLLGTNISEFLEGCSFNGKLCSSNSLSHFTNFRYGNCFSFNKALQNAESLRTTQTGFGSGLLLKLNLLSVFYSSTSHTVGAKVVVHDPKETPNVEEDGFILLPGYETSISLQQTVHRRLPDPYKDHCFDYGSQTGGSRNANQQKCLRSLVHAGTKFCEMRLHRSDAGRQEPPASLQPNE
ncbi:acid-sensing ion channel 4 [Caerostris darwini]|uniref:Acid-sensing ion channel 4 n=1 Tax=Caerostris darwini TaxID=1538125 RepID=A0AAV4RSF0_9ARAC|nr:acid-sensing ion channel 4 [Caerostris darwini]